MRPIIESEPALKVGFSIMSPKCAPLVPISFGFAISNGKHWRISQFTMVCMYFHSETFDMFTDDCVSVKNFYADVMIFMSTFSMSMFSIIIIV